MGQDKNFAEQKNEIEVSLARTILTQLDKKAVTFDQAQEMARFILSQIDTINNIDQMSSFLQNLSKKWPVFESTAGFYKLRAIEARQTEGKIQELTSSLQTGGGF